MWTAGQIQLWGARIGYALVLLEIEEGCFVFCSGVFTRSDEVWLNDYAITGQGQLMFAR